jgi:hypothetical protein
MYVYVLILDTFNDALSIAQITINGKRDDFY